MKFKRKPMSQQLKAWSLSRDKEYFALFMEQGTGKSKVLIDTLAHLWSLGKIDAALIFAPNGVHINWVRLELPNDVPDWMPTCVAYYAASMTRDERSDWAALLKYSGSDGLPIACINIEGMSSAKAYKAADDFCKSRVNILCAVDESITIKNPKANRTKAVMKLRKRHHFKYRRILTGTATGNSPFDLYGQCTFLSSEILGTTSYYAFKAEYAEMLPPGHGLLRHILERNPNAQIPQIVARGVDGQPMYKNIDKLQKLLAPHSYRVLKADCLDLPPKVYTRRFVTMTPQQTRVYNEMVSKGRVEWEGEDGETKLQIVNHRLAILTRLQQILGGYIVDEDTKTILPLFQRWEDNPRIVSLMEKIEDSDESIIIWAKFVWEIEQITKAIHETYGPGSYVNYYGDTKRKARYENIDTFQARKARFFIGNAESGGIGLTLTAATQMAYYSNSIKLIIRLQSEDRAHRKGQTNRVLYTDLEVLNSYDTKIISSLRSNKNIADAIFGDKKGVEFLRYV